MDLSKLINGDISIVTWICERRYMLLHIRFLAFFIAFFRAVIQAQRGRVWSSSMVLEIYGVIQLHASLHTTSLAPLGWAGAPFPFLLFDRSDALFGMRLTCCWVNLSSTNCGCNCPLSSLIWSWHQSLKEEERVCTWLTVDIVLPLSNCKKPIGQTLYCFCV